MALTDAQLAQRRRGITSTQLAAIVGQHPYTSALAVYVDKVGDEPLPFQGDEESAYWGTVLEPVILDEYDRRNDCKIERPQKTFEVELDGVIFLATPDGVGTESDIIIEAKSAGYRVSWKWGMAGTDEIPTEYLCQCAGLMLVLDRPVVHLAVLIGGQEYREYRIERDAGLEKLLVAKATAFWRDCVVKRQPPEPDHTDSAAEALKALYPDPTTTLLHGDDKAEHICADVVEARRAFKAAEEAKKRTQNRLQAHIGTAAGVDTSWGVFTWKADKNGRRRFHAPIERERNG